MTIVAGPLLRSITPGMFDDITGGIRFRTVKRANGIADLEFVSDLTPEQEQSVWERATSRDDDDQQTRAMMLDACTVPEAWTAPEPLPEGGALDDAVTVRINELAAVIAELSAQLVEARMCQRGGIEYQLGEQYRPTEPDEDP